MDISLAGKNGLDITQAIKSSGSHSMICIITSYDLPEYRDAALRCGADHFLVKSESNEAQIFAFVNVVLKVRRPSSYVRGISFSVAPPA